MIHFMIKLAVRRAYIDRFASYSWTKSHKLCTITPLSCFYCSGICNFFIFVLFSAIKCKWIQLYFLFLEYLSHLNILFVRCFKVKSSVGLSITPHAPHTIHAATMQSKNRRITHSSVLNPTLRAYGYKVVKTLCLCRLKKSGCV